MTSFLTVIIPTQNRTSLLLKVVDGLLSQSEDVGDQLEIVIVDDGSTQEVQTPLLELADNRQSRDKICYFYQQSRGPAAARNLGIREARGDLILFLGDDIIPLPGLLRAHVSAHTETHPEIEVAILGLADLAPAYANTPFAKWWRRWNFRYQKLLDNELSPDFSFFYTNNLSLKRELLLRDGMFDEAFQFAAYEDGELGARLEKKGMRLIFKPEAAAEHHHQIDLYAACRRMITRGKAYDLFIQKTGLQGISRVYLTVGKGPWMTPKIIRPLYRLADRLQSRFICSPLYITVSAYCFQVGRGQKPLFPEIM